MKRIFTLCAAMCTLLTGFAQTDTIRKPAPDTIRIGGMVIIREKGSKPQKENDEEGPRFRNRRDKEKRSNVSTNWWVIDLGFSNVTDNTNPSSAAAQAFAGNAYSGNQEWAKLRFGKSTNVNIWFFMQRLNLVKHAVNLKYGLGLELNNYSFDDTRVKFSKNPTTVSLDQNLANARKNKLKADYLTVPMMLNFNLTPDRHKGFGFSAGISAGVLYGSRQKTKLGSDVNKVKDDFDLERWKLSYIGELSLGPVKLYGSYAIKNMWAKGLDQVPYTVGFRISSW
jgi:hypothetical protein